MKESSKNERGKEKTGGAFCVDWRDIEESQNLKKNNKAENETEKEANLCEKNEGESTSQTDLDDGEKLEKNGPAKEVSDEQLARKGATAVEDSSVVEKRETSAPVKKPEAFIPNQIEAGTEKDRKKTVTFAPACRVHKQAAVSSTAVQGTSGGTSKESKRKMSSLSDGELKKRIRLTQKKKKKKRRQASK